MSTYPGGKEACHQKLINLIPPHQIYVEPFLGGGAIMRKKRPAKLNIGVEVNEDVLWLTALKLDPDPIIIDTFNNTRAGQLFDGRNPDQLKKAESRETVFAFIIGNALPFLSWFPVRDDRETFIYCDPPYLRETRKSKAPLYKNEFWTEAEHLRLLDKLGNLDCNIMISGYKSDLYCDLLKGWHTYQFNQMTRGGGLAEEWVWMNYAPPTLLHDFSLLGDGFRERERIKRKKTRWVERFKKTDPQERAAILWALAESGIINRSAIELASPEAAMSTVTSASSKSASMPAVAGASPE